MPDTLPALYTIGQTAGMLAVSTMTVRRIIDRGELTPTRIGGQLRFTSAEIARYIDTATRKTAAQ